MRKLANSQLTSYPHVSRADPPANAKKDTLATARVRAVYNVHA